MMSDDNQIVLYDLSAGVARITMNRPDKRNALNDELIAELKAALRRADQDQSVHCAVISGAGADFCSGADLSALQKISEASVAENLDDARSLMELFMLIREVHVPVVAAVRGRALAGGCGLALACDIVLAEGPARFGFPEVKIGFVPAMVMAILRRSTSEHKAFELLTTGRNISAPEAEALGLINHVFDAEKFDEAVSAFTGQFQSLSRAAVGLSKRLFYRTDGAVYDEALQAGADANAIARMSADCREGIARFLKK